MGGVLVAMGQGSEAPSCQFNFVEIRFRRTESS